MLEKALRAILPITESYTAKDNPLNLILPAYETLWRVVLRGFLEVVFRGAEAGPGWRQLLVAYLANPTSATFKRTNGLTGIAVAFIVQETLRLYPPTRRIYRHVRHANNADPPKLLAADIEFLHRDPKIWGKDSRVFNPSRWKKVSKKCQETYMPFGWGLNSCPAKHDFGPRMIGLAVAALVDKFEDGWTLDAGREEDCVEVEGPLDAGRDSYVTLKLSEMRPCS